MSILVSDYDGTFANGKSNIRINCAAVSEFIKKGNIFVLSSGRSYESLTRKVEEHNIPYNFLACADGNYLFDENGNLLLSSKMDREILPKVDRLRSIKGYERVDYAYERKYSKEYDAQENIGSLAFIFKKPNVTNEFRDEFERIKQENPSYDYSVYGYNDEEYFMIKPRSVSKASPIVYLEKKLSLPKSEIFTVGDALNDLEMIRDYNGFLIGDNPELKKVALGSYESVHELIDDIERRKVKRR